jgi:hypothetical protein
LWCSGITIEHQPNCQWQFGGAACKPQPQKSDPTYPYQNHLISFEIEWFFFLARKEICKSYGQNRAM